MSDEETQEKKIESKIYIFKGKTKHSHLSLDNHKSVNDKGTIELDSEDLKRPIIKKMIKDGKNPECHEDKLIIAEKPKEN